MGQMPHQSMVLRNALSLGSSSLKSVTRTSTRAKALANFCETLSRNSLETGHSYIAKRLKITSYIVLDKI